MPTTASPSSLGRKSRSLPSCSSAARDQASSPSDSPSESPSESPADEGAATSDDPAQMALDFMDDPGKAAIEAYNSFSCPAEVNVEDNPDRFLVTCGTEAEGDANVKYLLSPAAIEGTDLKSAEAAVPDQQVNWIVRLEIGGQGVWQGQAGVRRWLQSMGPAGLSHGQLNDRVQFDVTVAIAAGGNEAWARGIELGMLRWELIERGRHPDIEATMAAEADLASLTF